MAVRKMRKMKKYLVLVLFLIVILSACTSESYLNKNMSEEDLIKSLGYEKLYSDSNIIYCDLGDVEIREQEILGMDCVNENVGTRRISVVGTNDEPTNILIIPNLKEDAIVTLDYDFPSRECILDQINNYVRSLEGDESLTIDRQTGFYDLIPFFFNHHVELYETENIGFPLFMTVNNDVVENHIDSFVVAIGSDNIARLFAIIRGNQNRYELIHEFD